VIDLQRGVFELEPFLKFSFEVAAEPVAVGAGVDEDMSRQGGKAGRNFPNVQIVYLDNTRAA